MWNGKPHKLFAARSRGAQKAATLDGARPAPSACAAGPCRRPAPPAVLPVCVAGQPNRPEALIVIVRPPGFTTRVLDDDSRFTIVTWTVVLPPADSERTPTLMVRSSGSGFWIRIPET